MESDLERALAFQIKALQLPEPETQYRAVPGRRFRWDFAWPEHKLAAEVQGGIWKRTETGRSAGHAFPARMAKDYEKNNLAVMLGWRVLYFTPKMVRGGEAVGMLERFFREGR